MSDFYENLYYKLVMRICRIEISKYFQTLEASHNKKTELCRLYLFKLK